MGRTLRVTAGGYVYHVLNRGNGRMTIFEDDADYAAFERVLAEGLARYPGVRLLAYALMPNHWHLVLHPRRAGELSAFVGWVTLTHTQRWHAHRHTAGGGHVYQGRFKSFLVEAESCLLAVCRYVERNALRAKLCNKAEAWRWSSLWRWRHPECVEGVPPLSAWPLPGVADFRGRGRPRDWLARVNRPQGRAEEEAIRHAITRGVPLGRDRWRARMIARHHLQSTLTPRGRPRKHTQKGS